MLFSATLDKAVDVLVKQYLRQPKTHEADSAQATISTMAHHVLHLKREHRLPVLVDLTSAPGRTVVFTRTKHGAKALARQLNGNGIPTVDLHGNLSQGARTRNMEAFHSGKATTLVATDVAARGIHVDDVALVVHADPPSEHKAYLHRSGRTARAGADGTVVTLMTDEQVREVRALTRAAGINPTTTKLDRASHAVLQELKPGVRSHAGRPASRDRRGPVRRQPRPAQRAAAAEAATQVAAAAATPRRGGRVAVAAAAPVRRPVAAGREARPAPARVAPHSAASFSSKAR